MLSGSHSHQCIGGEHLTFQRTCKRCHGYLLDDSLTGILACSASVLACEIAFPMLLYQSSLAPHRETQWWSCLAVVVVPWIVPRYSSRGMHLQSCRRPSGDNGSRLGIGSRCVSSMSCDCHCQSDGCLSSAVVSSLRRRGRQGLAQYGHDLRRASRRSSPWAFGLATCKASSNSSCSRSWWPIAWAWRNLRRQLLLGTWPAVLVCYPSCVYLA